MVPSVGGSVVGVAPAAESKTMVAVLDIGLSGANAVVCANRQERSAARAIDLFILLILFEFIECLTFLSFYFYDHEEKNISSSNIETEREREQKR